jgi:glycyl-tRNA synthetase beta subunit
MPQGVLHSYRKEQREAVNDLVRKVIVTDMAAFNPERFMDWTKNLNYQFGKAGLTLRYDIRQGTVNFTVKDIRSGRKVYGFHTSTRVLFDDSEVIPVEEKVKKF